MPGLLVLDLSSRALSFPNKMWIIHTLRMDYLQMSCCAPIEVGTAPVVFLLCKHCIM